MEINGHELTSVAFIAGGGPLWNATAPDGSHVLVTLRAPEEGQASEERWRRWAGLRSPHVVTLLDVARHEDGRWALVMERVEGDTLEVLMARGGLRARPAREAVVEGLARGLEALHGAGLVHGDVSPANVVVGVDGIPVLVDLVDSPGVVEGTPGWGTGTSGPQGDVESLGRIAGALGLEFPGAPGGTGGVTGTRGEAAVGGAPGRDAGAGSWSVAPAAGVLPEPVAEEVGGRVLRGVALSAPTRRRDAPARHRARKGRLPVVVTLVLLIGGLSVGVPAVRSVLQEDVDPASGSVAIPGSPGREPAGDTVGGGQGGSASGGTPGGARGETPACPGDDVVRGAFRQLVGERDAALESGDQDALVALGHGELGEADLGVLHLLESRRTTLHGLGTEVGDVDVVACTRGRVEFRTSLRQLPHSRCVGERCSRVPVGRERSVTVSMSRDPWQVLSVADDG